ncbi:acyl-CoA dehydrogenase family protein [Cytobacillus sp. Bac17]|uniref:acyl-CoA dehydrogenase family protein n=1 Tax=Cytobacillus sp. Bac17 TaxID=2926008 RepID=UPI002118B4DD|nr:acyl-CoA dehydrogenase family protein [Cytobacillus sp. Bac17]
MNRNSVEVNRELENLFKSNFHTLTLNKISAINYFEKISNLSYNYPSVALSISMHLYTIWGLKLLFNQQQYEWYADRIKKYKELFGSPNDPGLYFISNQSFKNSPFMVEAIKKDNDYIINGMKRFVSLEPHVRYLPIYCKVKDYKGNGLGITLLIVDKNKMGVSVKEDWNSISMKDTSSNTVKFNDVLIEEKDVVFTEDVQLNNADILSYLFRLSICSVYYGIAHKSIDLVTNSCKQKIVPYSNTTLKFFPGVQFTIADMTILQETSRSQINHLCMLIDDYISQAANSKMDINITSLITKEYVLTSSEKIVNLAMKVEGISSLFDNNELSKLYMDVKASNFHPPQTDVIKEIIGKNRLGVITRNRRWL